uniref:Uncharacterized protein n=1 Tax=Physcomitrium patens TaxID=3218 RepID=A0A2K1KBP2_PHYPA|nr:hypothetical protein PHYPA_010377 [Physcomitrium patens]
MAMKASICCVKYNPSSGCP